MADCTTKHKILETMYALVAERGYDKTSIGQLAERIGIQKPSIYYYFKSKEAIFMALVEELYRDDYADKSALFADAQNAQEFRAALIATGEGFIESYFTHQTLRKVYAEIDIQSTRIPALKDFIGSSDKRFHLFLTHCMERGGALAAFPAGFDAALYAQILYTTLIGIDQCILYDLPVDPKPVWRAVVLALWGGEEPI